jgi:hypothetical protein
MFEFVLHTGTEHPDLLWIAVPVLAAFAGGLGIGLFSRARSGRADTATESAAVHED